MLFRSDIVKSLDGSIYVNSIGGLELYDKEHFMANDVHLKFIKMKNVNYEQLSKEFIPNLSIIDVLMNCDVSTAKELLLCCELS